MRKLIITLVFILLANTTNAGYFMNQKIQHPFRPVFVDGFSVGNMDLTNWDEISGISRGQRTENLGHFWAVDDGRISPAVIQAMRASDGSNRGEWTLTAGTGVDLEDIASARIQGQPYLWVCDTGDNAGVRATINLFRIKEPIITGSNGTLAGSDVDYMTIVANYPASPVGEGGTASRDAESCFADPSTGDLYVLTKRTTQVQVFMLPFALTYSGTQTMTYLGDMFQLPNTNQASGANGGRAVGADISPNGKEILVKNYEDIFHFKRTNILSTTTIYSALTATPTTIEAYVGGGRPSSHPNGEPQGESVAFDDNGQNIYTASEYNATFDSGMTSFPFFRYLRVGTASTTELSLQEGVNGYAGTSDTYIWSNAVNQGDNNGAVTTFIIDYDSAVSERYGLLKFNLTGQIASTSKIIGADLQLYVNTEGALYETFAMYQSWVEASSWTSLGGPIAYDGTEAATASSTISGDYATLVGTTTLKIPVSLVQGWVDGTIPNNGLIFDNIGVGGNGFQMRSSEYSSIPNRPKLIIRYINK